MKSDIRSTQRAMVHREVMFGPSKRSSLFAVDESVDESIAQSFFCFSLQHECVRHGAQDAQNAQQRIVKCLDLLVSEWAGKKGVDLSEALLKRAHALLCPGKGAGEYRKNAAPVVDVSTVPARLVQEEMSQYVQAVKLVLKRVLEPEEKAAFAILWFLIVQPFATGNGRLARLIGLAVLRREGAFKLGFSLTPTEELRKSWIAAISSGNKNRSCVDLTAHVHKAVVHAQVAFDAFRAATALANQNNKNKGASGLSMLEMLRQGVSEPCVICYDEDSDMLALCCGKPYHFSCVKSWFDRGKNKCPHCQAVIKGLPRLQDPDDDGMAAIRGGEVLYDVCAECEEILPMTSFDPVMWFSAPPRQRTCVNCDAARDRLFGSDEEEFYCEVCQSHMLEEDLTEWELDSGAGGICVDCRLDGNRCVLCREYHDNACFSANQMRKPHGERKCVHCLNERNDNYDHGASRAHVRAPAAAAPISSVIRVPAHLVHAAAPAPAPAPARSVYAPVPAPAPARAAVNAPAPAPAPARSVYAPASTSASAYASASASAAAPAPGVILRSGIGRVVVSDDDDMPPLVPVSQTQNFCVNCGSRANGKVCSLCSSVGGICCACNHFYGFAEFSSSQLRKDAAQRRCVNCVASARMPPAGNNNNNNNNNNNVVVNRNVVNSNVVNNRVVNNAGQGEFDVCCICYQQRNRYDFSRNQWLAKLPGQRKCMYCVG